MGQPPFIGRLTLSGLVYGITGSTTALLPDGSPSSAWSKEKFNFFNVHPAITIKNVIEITTNAQRRVRNGTIVWASALAI